MKSPHRMEWLALLAAVSLCASAQAFDWPLSRSRIESTFGSPLEGYFLPGIVLSSPTASVSAIGKGEKKFYQADGMRSSSMPTALGTMVAMIHTEGMESIYANLERLSDNLAEREIPAKSMVGTVGQSGWAAASGLFLGIFDTKTAHWVNPLLILPARSGGVAPAILSVALINAGVETILGNTTGIPQGSYTVSSGIHNLSGSQELFEQSAPYEIQLTVDGKDVARKVFDLLWWKDGRRKLFATGTLSRAEVLDKNGRYRLADVFLPRGKTTIGIIVMDAAGHRRKAEWTVNVR